MGNSSSSDAQEPRRSSTAAAGHPPPPQNVFAAYPNTSPYYQYPGFYPHPAAMPIPLPAPHANWVTGRYPMLPPQPTVEQQKATTFRNDVNVKKDTLRVDPDEDDSGKFLVSFSFDATVAGSLTLVFFAKVGEDCQLTPTKESLYQPITVQFQKGILQKFKQPSGTGIDLSNVPELSKDSNSDIYPLTIKVEALPDNESGNADSGSTNAQITLAVFEKEKEEYKVKVAKQVIWMNGMKYELQEIFGIGNSVEDEFDHGKECVVCLSEPRDTTVLPCRHMCMCSECAKILRFQTNRCPICRQPIERLLEIKVSNGTD